MSALFEAAELVYTRGSAGIGELVGGGDEHWEISDTDGRIVATAVETDLTMVRRLGRFLNSRFPLQQRRRIEIRDPSGEVLFAIVRQPPKLGLEYAEVRGDGDAAVGTIRLVDSGGQNGLGCYDVHDERLGEIRPAPQRTSATGHQSFDVLAGETEVGELASTRIRFEGGPIGYRLEVGPGVADPLRTMIYASPIVRYFIS